MTVDISQRDYFEDLLHQARHILDCGELQRALEIFDEADEWAKQWGDRDDADRVYCSRLAVQLHLGEANMVIGPLRMVLMRSSNPINQFLAAANVSFCYQLSEDFKKSRFYAELALDHAKRSGSDLFLATSYSYLGNLSIRESFFPEALEYYEKAWDLYDDEEVYKRLAIRTSMGFCHLASNRFDEGFSKLFAVRRQYRKLRLGPTIATGRLRLAFCFGYLQSEKFHQAVLHGKVATRIGEECEDQDVIKKALYLLGEAEKLRGDEMKAFTYFARLQEDFYPDNPQLPEILLYNDTKKLVNVWA